jgi:hypothetical protein
MPIAVETRLSDEHIRLGLDLQLLHANGDAGYDVTLPLGAGLTCVEFYFKGTQIDAAGVDAQFNIQAFPLHLDGVTSWQNTNVVAPNSPYNWDRLETLIDHNDTIAAGTTTGLVHTSGAATPHDACGHGLFVDYLELTVCIWRALRVRFLGNQGAHAWSVGAPLMNVDLLWHNLKSIK